MSSTEKAIAELTARAEKAEHERDAQHALVLKLTVERDEVALQYRTAAAGWEEKGRNLREDLDAARAAAAAWEVQAQDFRDKLVAAEENNSKAICVYCGRRQVAELQGS